MNRLKKLRRISDCDMSPSAVDRRLRDLAQLYKLGMSIMRAKYVGPVEQTPKSEKDVHSPNVSDNSRM
jgi:hypothetical protein